MFAPVESLPFGVDLSLNAAFLPNALALRIARRRIQDADQIVRAESDGDQGVSDLGYQRTQEARDLLSYLQASSRPSLLRATLAIAVSACSGSELEARVEWCAACMERSACTDHLAISCRCSRSTCRAADEGGWIRRHADSGAGGGDDADRDPYGGLAQGLLPGAHALGLAPAGQVQSKRGV